MTGMETPGALAGAAGGKALIGGLTSPPTIAGTQRLGKRSGMDREARHG